MCVLIEMYWLITNAYIPPMLPLSPPGANAPPPHLKKKKKKKKKKEKGDRKKKRKRRGNATESYSPFNQHHIHLHPKHLRGVGLEKTSTSHTPAALLINSLLLSEYTQNAKKELWDMARL